MRLQVEVRPEDQDPLRHLAFDAHRSVREQASYLLHLKIREEALKLDGSSTDALDQVAVG